MLAKITETFLWIQVVKRGRYKNDYYIINTWLNKNLQINFLFNMDQMINI